MIRVVVADDHPMFRFGLRALLDLSDDIDLIAEASSGSELLALVDQHAPDVVLTDLSMPDLDGISASRVIRKRHPDIAVVIITMHGDDESLAAAIAAGSNGYLLKGADGDTIIRAIRAAAAGDAVYGSGIAHKLGSALTSAGRKPFPGLTEREREILSLMAAGCTNSQIAARLAIADKTVRNNISAILLKLQVIDRVGAVLRAREAGLGTR